MILADQFHPGTFVDAVRFIGDNPGFLATKALEQFELSGAALGVALVVALPLGIVLGHFHRGSNFAIGTSIVGRALPSLALIAAFLTVLGIGFTNNMVALAVLATGPILTNAYDGVDGVDRDVVEAARGMGMSATQLLLRVELPLAAPLIFAGIQHRVRDRRRNGDDRRRSPAGAGSATSSSTRRATGWQGVVGAALCVMALSAAVWIALIVIGRTLTPRALREG